MSTEKIIYGIRGIKLASPYFPVAEKKWKPLYDKINEVGSMFDFFDDKETKFVVHTPTETLIEVIADGMNGAFFAIGEVFMRIDEDDDDFEMRLGSISDAKKESIANGIKKALDFDDVSTDDIQTYIFTLCV